MNLKNEPVHMRRGKPRIYIVVVVVVVVVVRVIAVVHRIIKSGSKPSVFDTFDLKMCFAPQRRALFRHVHSQKWLGPEVFCHFLLPNVLRATTACTFSTS